LCPDASTSAGKVPTGVAKLAQFHSKPCIVIAGSVAPDARLQESGILAAFSICNGPVTLDYAMKHGAELLARVTEQIVTVWLRARESHLSKL
jgi:glycerate kinase